MEVGAGGVAAGLGRRARRRPIRTSSGRVSSSVPSPRPRKRVDRRQVDRQVVLAKLSTRGVR